MIDSFLETTIEALKEIGAVFIVTDVDERHRRRKTVYRGEWGETCPGCDVSIGEKHLKDCVFEPQPMAPGADGV